MERANSNASSSACHGVAQSQLRVQHTGTQGHLERNVVGSYEDYRFDSLSRDVDRVVARVSSVPELWHT